MPIGRYAVGDAIAGPANPFTVAHADGRPVGPSAQHFVLQTIDPALQMSVLMVLCVFDSAKRIEK